MLLEGFWVPLRRSLAFAWNILSIYMMFVLNFSPEARGENLRWFPPYLRCVADALPEIPFTIRSFDFFEVWKKVSEIMSKCVFGLRLCGRITCAPFSKRGKKSD